MSGSYIAACTQDTVSSRPIADPAAADSGSVASQFVPLHSPRSVLQPVIWCKISELTCCLSRSGGTFYTSSGLQQPGFKPADIAVLVIKLGV